MTMNAFTNGWGSEETLRQFGRREVLL